VREHQLRLHSAVPLTGIGIALGCGVGLTAGILFGSVESMLLGAAAGVCTGVIAGAVADMLTRSRGLHPATLPLLTIPTGLTAGALLGAAGGRLVSASLAGLVAGTALGLFLNWVAKPKERSQ
jgi:iron complex transport system permease protein